MRCFISWSLRIAGPSHDIPMLPNCIYLEQGHCRGALHQCPCDVDRSRHLFPGLGHLCRRTPVAYDLESPDHKTRKDCHQRRLPSGVIVRSIFSPQETSWLTARSIAIVNLIRLPKLIYVSPDDLTCRYSVFPFHEMTRLTY